jgi:exodeoxyribonuclease VII small subunit
MPGAKPDLPASAEPALEPSFERALERLEAVVERLEQGDLELEASLAAFEEGVRLTRQCAEQLDAAERRIEILVHEGDGWVARPLALGDAPDADEGAAGD